MGLDEAYVIEIMAIGVQKWEALQLLQWFMEFIFKRSLSDY
jgi:hypothetical protein